jgi:phage replication initiation protein
MAILVSTDDLLKEATDSVIFNSTTGSPAGFAGSTGNPGELPESLSSELCPIANRDIEITIPLENRSLLDWVSFTFKLDDPHEVVKIIALDPALFSSMPFGFSGYRKSLKLGNISIYFEGREDMGCHVEMTGQGCRHYEGYFSEIPWQELFETVLSVNGKFTRLDLAIDNVDGRLTLDKIWNAIQDHDKFIRTQFHEWRRIQKGSFEKGQMITGDTIYLGSTKSHVQCRIYDKAQESGVEGHWIRYEIQLRDKRAHEAAKLFASGVPVGSLATGIINNYFAIINDDDSNISRCTLQTWWHEWLQSTEKIQLATEQSIKLVPDSMDFIKRQYAPSIAMIRKYLGASQFKGFMDDILEDGQERMGAKHEKILSDSESIGRVT